ncbi:hypothetical protein ACJJIR_01330 [Microbulbifer sp. SSSA008]|uniref:hypothetical protein n=1 Tax=Microbulbifer sp. SSSA008 TaxID=3243380 RepID=UPI00403A0A05
MTWNTLIEEMNLEEIPFANDELSYLDTQSIEVGECKVGAVDLTRVIGTTHPDYQGKTWGQLKPIPGTSKGDFMNNRNVAFQPLKRAIGNVQSLERNPEYYFSRENKEHWSFYKINDDYYISAGNNRTIIGRMFLHLNSQEPLIHGVEITPAKFRKEPVREPEKVSVISRLSAWFKT